MQNNAATISPFGILLVVLVSGLQAANLQVTPGSLGPLEHWRIDASGGKEGMLLVRQGEVCIAACPLLDGRPAQAFEIQKVSGLKMTDSGAEGNIGKGASEFTIALTREGQRITGRVTGRRMALHGNKSPKSAAAEIDWKVTGTVVSEASLQKTNDLAPAAAWPQYTGPTGTFTAVPTEAELLDDFSQARLAWISPYIGTTEAGSQRYGDNIGVASPAGGFSPLVANGKVFQFRFVPVGPVFNAHVDQFFAPDKIAQTQESLEKVHWDRARLEQKWWIDADEEAICLDAATGRVLWRTRIFNAGLSYFDHKCSLTNHTGIVTDKLFVALGGLGECYAFDVETGKLRWQTAVPGLSETLRRLKEESLEKRTLKAPTRSFGHALIRAGDSVLACTGIGESGIAAISLSDGTIRWQTANRPGIIGDQSSPTVLTLENKLVVLAADSRGNVTCLDAASGKELWKLTGLGNHSSPPLYVGDRMIARATPADEFEKQAAVTMGEGRAIAHPDQMGLVGQIGCWRLTLTGAEQIWLGPKEIGTPTNAPLGTVIGDVAMIRTGNTLYQLDVKTGKILSQTKVTIGRTDEKISHAMNDMFIHDPSTQHGDTQWINWRVNQQIDVAPDWIPPHPPATTYTVALSHALVDGRVIFRGHDRLYCYDLRKPSRVGADQ